MARQCLGGRLGRFGSVIGECRILFGAFCFPIRGDIRFIGALASTAVLISSSQFGVLLPVDGGSEVFGGGLELFGGIARGRTILFGAICFRTYRDIIIFDFLSCSLPQTSPHSIFASFSIAAQTYQLVTHPSTSSSCLPAHAFADQSYRLAAFLGRRSLFLLLGLIV